MAVKTDYSDGLLAGSSSVTPVDTTFGSESPQFGRQIKVPAGLVRIVAANPDSGDYDIEYFTNSVVGTPDEKGAYDLQSASPFRTWSFTSPGGSVVMRVDDGRGRVYDFSYSSSAPAIGWTLVEKDDQGATLRTKRRTHNGGSPRIETYQVEDNQSNVFYRQEIEYDTTTYSWGMAKAAERVYTSWNGQSGSALTTTYTYYDNPQIPAIQGKLKTVTYPDGSWIIYTYDTQGRKATEVRSWKDVTLASALVDPTPARELEYSYARVDGTEPDDPPTYRSHSPRKVTERVEGYVTSISYLAYYIDTQTGDDVQIVEQDADGNPATGYGSTENPRTTTRYYSDLLSGPEAGQIRSTKYPDGRMTTYSYDTGDYTPNDPNTSPGAFESDEDGKSIQTLVVELAGSPANPVAVPKKTTLSETVRGPSGRTRFSRTWVCTDDDPLAYSEISWSVYDYDTRNRLVGVYGNNNTQQTFVPTDCCGQASSATDAYGTVTETEHNKLGHLEKQIKKGLEQDGSDDVITEYNPDIMGRPLTQNVHDGADTITLTSSTQYDLAGRTNVSTDPRGLSTQTDYVAATSTVGASIEVTYPSPQGAPITRITQQFLDGRVKSVTGTSLVHQYFDYGVNADGTQWRIAYTGPPGAQNRPWTKTIVDHLGRTIKVERPAHGGGTLTTEQFYYGDNSSIAFGKLRKVTQPGLAPTLYEYDATGRQLRSGLDLNGDEDLDITEDPVTETTDRAMETETTYETNSGNWWQQTVYRVYATEGSGTATTASTTLQRLTGFAANVVDESRFLDAHDNQTTTTVTVDRANKLVTRAVDHPDSDSDEVTITRNGLMESVTSESGLTTDFAYDEIGRQEYVTDPRTGASQMSYDSLGQVEWTKDAAGKQTTYTYDSATGQQKSIADPNGKVRYFDYSPRGEMINTWGTATYPIAYAYDDFGRRTHMKTWQDAGTWTSSTWPDPEPTPSFTTTWAYEDATGLLESKTDAASEAVEYDYYTDGRLQKRTWARGVYAEYGYDGDTGELLSVTYSDDTPDVEYTYDRLGRIKTVTDVVGTHTFTYTSTLELDNEAIVAGQSGLYTKTITRSYQTSPAGIPGRYAGFSIGQDYTAEYGHDAKGRLNKVVGPGLTNYGVTYSRTTDSELVGTVEYWADASTRSAWSTRTYEEHRNLLTQVRNDIDDGTPTVMSQYDYENDDGGRRKNVLNTGYVYGEWTYAGYNIWTYNDRSELISSYRYRDDEIADPPDPQTEWVSERRTYTYDAIGNRTESAAAGGTAVTYTRTDVNEYSQTSVTNDAFEYDDDGDLTEDSAYEYVWDGENRLIRIGPVSPVNQSKKLEFTYD